MNHGMEHGVSHPLAVPKLQLIIAATTGTMACSAVQAYGVITS